MTDATADRRRRLAEKIAALRAKTISAGCTEAEALAAAELARKLMSEHGLADEEIGAAEARVDESTFAPAWHAKISDAVATCTNTVVMIVRDRGRSTRIFIGREPGPAIALYLRDVCFHAVETEVAAFKASFAYWGKRLNVHRDRAEEDFTFGLVERLTERLKENWRLLRSAAERDHAVAVRAAWYPAGTDIHTARRRLRDADAAAAGRRAADGVGLHDAVGMAAGAPRLIGGRR